MRKPGERGGRPERPAGGGPLKMGQMGKLKSHLGGKIDRIQGWTKYWGNGVTRWQA